MFGASLVLFNGCDLSSASESTVARQGVQIKTPSKDEDIFSYIKREKGNFDLTFYRQILGAANEYKEGDQTLEINAENQASRLNARTLLSATKLKDLNGHSVYEDDISALIDRTTQLDATVLDWTLGKLKSFVLQEPETEIKKIMPALHSDVIACLVKLMSNDELIRMGQKVFNPLPNSNIGSKGYMSARVQPNSPTDHPEDIIWQVFDAWSYAVGDLLLGTNPVSSEPSSVAKIEEALFDVLTTFGLEETMPNCVLSHIDVQAEVEKMAPGTTGIWFQSLAGTVNANQTFDVTIDKMFDHADKRTGRFGLYAETGQGADFTNGHGEGFDMVIHESRKYGFLRAIKQRMSSNKSFEDTPWVIVNDVAGFIGPEVFRTKEQLVRCCLEDTVMGKLHGLTIGLDICSTLHMDVTLDDLDWCIEQVMPANPAYLMALPTKNDPMLSYLTTAFSNHVKIREQFGYKVNDPMWDFFKKIQIIDANGEPTEHFGDPTWVYYQYCLAQNDERSQDEIIKEGQQAISRIKKRGVPIAEGYGDNIWDLHPELDDEVHRLYEDAKVSLWTAMETSFVAAIPNSILIETTSKDRKDYVYHPESGEQLNLLSIKTLQELSDNWKDNIPDVQIIISDGLNARSLMDEGHLAPFLKNLRSSLEANNYQVSKENIVITHGRVRAGYQCGEILFGRGDAVSENQVPHVNEKKGIIHIIGERPGSGHHNFSAYITAAPVGLWHEQGKVDHDISRVVSGISDTALLTHLAVEETVGIFGQLYS